MKKLIISPHVDDEVIACGIAPKLSVTDGTATAIATGGPIPRGADAVVMVEHTQPAGAAIEIRRSVLPGQFVSYAGSDIARGETLLRAGTLVGSREIGMLAASGIALVAVGKKPRVAIMSTGDELMQPGKPLRPAAIYDTNGAIVAAGRAIAGDTGRPSEPPDAELRRVKSQTKDEPPRYEVELLGIDVFDPTTMEVINRQGDQVPAWFLDTDYNGL